MKIGVVGWCLGRVSFEESLKICEEIGADFLEFDFAIFRRGEPLTESEVATLKTALGRHHVSIGCISGGNDFVQEDAVEMGREVQRVITTVDAAVDFCCEVVRVFGGEPKENISEERYPSLIAQGFKECVPYAEEKGVILAMENHGRITNDAELELRILEEVGSENFRITVDPSNFLWYGHPVETVARYLEMLVPYTEHTHLKDGHARKGKMKDYTALALGEGDVPLEIFCRGLKERGYQRPLFIEYEGSEDRKEGLAKGVRYLHQLEARWKGGG